VGTCCQPRRAVLLTDLEGRVDDPIAALGGRQLDRLLDCQSPPDIGAWGQISDPDERLRTALGELYGYYSRTGEMLDRLLRDAPRLPVVRKLMAPFGEMLAAAAEILMRGRGLRGRARERVQAAIGHALAFPTWQQLTGEQRLDAAAAVELMARFVDAAA